MKPMISGYFASLMFKQELNTDTLGFPSIYYTIVTDAKKCCFCNNSRINSYDCEKCEKKLMTVARDFGNNDSRYYLVVFN